jgi:hypothetical protein
MRATSTFINNGQDEKVIDLIRIASFHGVAKIIVALGQIAIAIVITISGFVLCRNIHYKEAAYAEISYVVMVIAFGSLIVCIVFLGTYSIAIDALFLCYCEDMKRNNGTAQHPYHMSKRMRSLMNTEIEIVQLE